jgi:hypothetical protein
MNGGMVTFENCVFDSCDASRIEHYRGGAGFVGTVAPGPVSRGLFRWCVFSHNTAVNAGAGGAVVAQGNAEVTFEHCVFTGNSANAGGGLGLGLGAQATLANCTFSGNWCLPGGDGGSVYTYADLGVSISLENTILAFSSRGAAINVSGLAVVELNCCDVYGNAGEDWVGSIADQRGINGNIWGDPGFCDTLNGDFAIQATSPCMPDEFLGCGLIGARDDACSGTVRVVDPEGGGNFTTIQAALNSCLPWDAVELRDAVYTGAGNRDISLPSMPLTIRSQSGDPSACLIDCQGGPLNFRRAFTFSGGVGQESILRGVGITGGKAASSSGGGAIRCQNASPRIAGCLLFGNDGGSMGGAVLSQSGSYPALVRCTLSGNQAVEGGGLYCATSAGAALRASIVSFSSAGGAIGCGEDANPVLSCCDVNGNIGGDWWQTCIEDQRDLRWNFCVDPCFCDDAEDDYSLHDDSGCAGTWGACGVVGAMPIGGCGEGPCEQPQMSGVLEGEGSRTRWGCLRSVPSPFAPGGQIFYSIPDIAAHSRVVLTLHDAAGRLVRSLVDGALIPGENSVSWDGTSGVGRPAPVGVYFCRLSIGGRMAVTPLLLLR